MVYQARRRRQLSERFRVASKIRGQALKRRSDCCQIGGQFFGAGGVQPALCVEAIARRWGMPVEHAFGWHVRHQIVSVHKAVVASSRIRRYPPAKPAVPTRGHPNVNADILGSEKREYASSASAPPRL